MPDTKHERDVTPEAIPGSYPKQVHRRRKGASSGQSSVPYSGAPSEGAGSEPEQAIWARLHEKKSSRRSSSYQKSPSPSKKSRELNAVPTEALSGVADVFAHAWASSKHSLGLVLGLAFVLFAIFTLLLGAARGTELALHRAHSVVCALPLVPRFMDSCPSRMNAPMRKYEMDSFVKVHEKLDEIQQMAAGGVSLPLYIKRAEVALREVSKKVELSDLPSKEVLLDRFASFQEQTQNADRHVSTFITHVSRVFHKAMGMTATFKGKLEHRGLPDSGRNSKLRLDGPRNKNSKALSHYDSASLSSLKAIRQDYLAHLDSLKDDIDVLIIENQLAIQNMNGIENLLYEINDQVIVDEDQIKGAKRDLKSKYLSLVGWYKKDIGSLDAALDLIEELFGRRGRASAAISGVNERLRQVSRDIEEFRLHIVEQEAAGESEAVSVQYQILVLDMVLDKMHKSDKETEEAKQKSRQQLLEQIDDRFRD